MPDIWQWVPESVGIALHQEIIETTGGIHGIRDIGLLQSALSRPQNLAAYGSPDAAELAASYAQGIARNHAFTDGNKRTAFAVADTFLRRHGYRVEVSATDLETTMVTVASGAMSEADLALWFGARMVPHGT
jgi:death on curing protein